MNSLLSFGEWLRRSRDNLGLTRKEFAKRVGCSVSTLRKIEEGERKPSGQVAELIANCLRIPEDERSTFVRVARGDLGIDRLQASSKLVALSDIPSASNGSTPRVNLPLMPTPLIGRQSEVEELGRLLRDPQCRLITLVGPGGIGKTRLAIETASHFQDVFPDGVYFVPLVSINATSFVMPVIADAIGFTFQGTDSIEPKTQLSNYLKEKRLLLLADNLEHLLTEPGIELLAELLAHAPQVKLLVTSRETLGLQGEWVFEVHGLPVPEDPHTEGFAHDTSVELFLQRARRAHVEFNAGPKDFPAILRICRLVEGVPLAIELAAAWVRTLTCDEIAREIESGLDFLSISTRDLPTRHRSMRAVFEHSWKLLTEEEQTVLLRLSIFRGGFQRKGAEQVAGATLSMLSTLVTKSLIRRNGEGRYDLHELIRQFAADHFANQPEEQSASQDRHSSYYLILFSGASDRLASSVQLETLTELTVEMDNFRIAWEWALSHDKFALVEQTLRTFGMFYDLRNWWQEGFDILSRAINVLETASQKSPSDRTTQIALGHCLTICALLTSRLGHFEQAESMFERSLRILRPLNELRVLVEPVTFLGNNLERTGNYTRAMELYTEGLEIATAIDDRWFAALCRLCHISLVGITQTMVEPDKTREQLLDVVTEWRAIGDPRFIAMAFNILSWNAMMLGRYEEAQTALEESAALNRSIGDRWGLGYAYRGLGIIAQMTGEHQQAIDIFCKSLDTLTELGARQDVARILAEMSRSIFATGNDAEAERGWRESLSMAIETKGTFIALEALVGIAALQAKQGKIEQAFELLLVVLNHPVSVQDTKDRASRLRADLEMRLTVQQIEAVHARTLARSFELIVDEVLNQTDLI